MNLEKTKGLSLLKGSVKKIRIINNEQNQVPNIGYHKIYKKFKRNEYSPYDKFEKKVFILHIHLVLIILMNKIISFIQLTLKPKKY